MSKNDNRIVLIGGGGHCKSVIGSLQVEGLHERAVITDSNLVKGTLVDGIRVVGTDELLPVLYEAGYTSAVIAVGHVLSSTVRRQIYIIANRLSFDFPSVIDHSAIVAEGAEIGRGVFLGKGSIVNSGSIVGDFSIINTGGIIEHDCRVGEFTHVAPGAVICGGVNIGNDVLVGANATIIQGVKIGNRSIVGAGSVILSDVPDNTTAVGVWKG